MAFGGKHRRQGWSVRCSLERWYDLDIRADEALYGKRVTAVFVANQPNEMIDALAIALDATATRKGRVVTLTQNKR